MSLLIKGLKMPKEGCKDCQLVKRGQVYDICPFLKREVNGNVERGGKPYDCPLGELPDHGDLIDRDKLILALEMQDYSCAPDTLAEWTPMDMTIAEIADLKHAPVVIPAERSEDPSHPFADDVMMGERSD